MAFRQLDREITFSELARTIVDIHSGAAAIGLVSIVVLVAWDKCKPLTHSAVPAPLVVVLLGEAARFFAVGEHSGVCHRRDNGCSRLSRNVIQSTSRRYDRSAAAHLSPES